MFGKLFTCLILLGCCVSPPLSAAAEQDGPAQSAFALRWENDVFGVTDANYTSGISFALLRPGEGLLGGVWDLRGPVDGHKSTVYELTQLQFTPSDINLDTPPPSDRPYAGLTYLACTTHLQREESLHSLKLITGVVGPAAGGRDVQRYSHRLLDQTPPRGWSHQLKNEPVVNFVYEYRHRYRLTPSNAAFGVELIPMGGGFLGNYLTQAQSEVLLRIGYQLPDDFGTTSLRGIGFLPLPRMEETSPSWGVNAFIRGGVNLVARNLALDGNTFAHSHSVDKREFVSLAEVGAVLWTGRFMTSVSYQVWEDEFNGQPVQERYGTVLLSYRY